jgi:hypothetical protein
MTQIVKAQGPQAGHARSATQCRPVEMAARLSREHQIVVADPVFAAARLRERRADIGRQGTARTWPDFGVVRCPA